MSTPPEAIELAEAMCCTFEGLRLKPYLCPAGVPTIGIGSCFYETGTRVTMNDPPITVERAKALLRLTLTRDYLPGVLRASPGLAGDPIRLGAILDFGYNCGIPRYRSSTLMKRVNAQNWPGARIEIMRWNRGGGRVLPGLTQRRKTEAALLCPG